jgi:hypothetical protein
MPSPTGGYGSREFPYVEDPFSRIVGVGWGKESGTRFDGTCALYNLPPGPSVREVSFSLWITVKSPSTQNPVAGNIYSSAFNKETLYQQYTDDENLATGDHTYSAAGTSGFPVPDPPWSVSGGNPRLVQARLVLQRLGDHPVITFAAGDRVSISLPGVVHHVGTGVLIGEPQLPAYWILAQGGGMAVGTATAGGSAAAAMHFDRRHHVMIAARYIDSGIFEYKVPGDAFTPVSQFMPGARVEGRVWVDNTKIFSGLIESNPDTLPGGFLFRFGNVEAPGPSNIASIGGGGPTESPTYQFVWTSNVLSGNPETGYRLTRITGGNYPVGPGGNAFPPGPFGNLGDCCIHRLVIYPGQFVDWDSPVMREKFQRTDPDTGKVAPADIGSTGSLPLGVAPYLFLQGGPDSFFYNRAVPVPPRPGQPPSPGQPLSIYGTLKPC